MFDAFPLFPRFKFAPIVPPSSAWINAESIVECPCSVVERERLPFTLNRSGIIHPRVVKMFILCFGC